MPSKRKADGSGTGLTIVPVKGTSAVASSAPVVRSAASTDAEPLKVAPIVADGDTVKSNIGPEYSVRALDEPRRKVPNAGSYWNTERGIPTKPTSPVNPPSDAATD